MTTLHRYVLRDLLKTFGLAVVAMTALFTLAGGVYNVISQEGVGAAELFYLLPLLIPVIVTFTMPLAALFAATSTYGRLAADNELTACRAAGINIHRLLASAVLLSVFVALFSVIFINVVIPGMLGQINNFVRSNLRGIAEQRLKTQGAIVFTDPHGRFGIRGQLLLTAQGVRGDFDAERLRARGWDPSLGYLEIVRPTFLQLDENGEIERFTTAELGWCQFDTSKNPLEVTVIVTQAREFTLDRRITHVAQQTIGPIPLDYELRAKPSLLDMNSLIRLYHLPWEARDIAKGLRDLRYRLLLALVHEHIAEQVAADRPFLLPQRDGRTLRIQAAAASEDRGRITLRDVRVELDEPDPARPSRYTAPQAILVMEPERDDQIPATLRLIGRPDAPVRADHPGSTHFRRAREKDIEVLDNGLLPAELPAAVADIPDPHLLDRTVPLPVADAAAEAARDKLVKAAAHLQRVIISLFHFRFGFAASALVTVVMGAALGIIFRGGRALAAFGLSTIPFALAALLIVMGRQTAVKPGTALLGGLIIWGGLTALAIADAIIVRLGVRR